ncbi:MAG: carbon-nitrogen hydrolase family protein [Phycisphaeraceae bacterium]|nr:carbon-nitrogen hydrolase family protein [Phycisphaeraceae bacterium]
MGQPIIVSAFATPMPPAPAKVDDAAVDQMIDLWRQRLAAVLPDRPDLILLPEVCDLFDFPAHDPSLATAFCQLRGDRVLTMLQDTAARHQCHIGYCTNWQLPDGSWRNRLHLIGRRGDILGHYDKAHPTEGELDQGIIPGPAAPALIECDFGKVAGVICFDLNFARLRQHYARLRPDLILFSSVYHGSIAQNWWAYECRCHLLCAQSGYGRTPAQLVSPTGEWLAASTNYFPHVTAAVNLDCALVHLDFHWETLNRMKQELGREVDIHDPGRLGSVLVTRCSPQGRVGELLTHYGLTTLDDYLARAQQRQDAVRVHPE